MKAVGIIAEYNPFHNGHKYQIQQAKQTTGADIVIIVMSGNWVQRGQPAIIDKWQRAEIALNNGADIVIELPVQAAVQAADIFAKKAVEILSKFHCEWLAFGSEHPELDFEELAKKDLSNSNFINNDYKKSYASLIREAIGEATGKNISDPNDVLALNYAIANNKMEHHMKLVPILRKGSNHHDKDLNHDIKMASASSIRDAIETNRIDETADFLPTGYDKTVFNQICSWNDFWSLLKYKVTTSSIDELENIYQMNEGLEYRFKKFIYQANSFDEFISLIKSKRYTYSRLRRLCVYTLLNWKKDDDLGSQYARILAFNKFGNGYLNHIKKDIKLPIITKIDKHLSENELKFDVNAGKIYESINNRKQDVGKHPIIY